MVKIERFNVLNVEDLLNFYRRYVMKTYTTTSDRLGHMSNSRKTLGGLGKIALTTSLVFLTLGGFSSAWAGDQHNATTRSPYLHLTGVSIHLDLGLLHLGGHHNHYRPTQHHHYRHGHHNYGHRNHYARHGHYNRHDKHNGPRYFRGHDGSRGHRGNHAVSQSYRGHRNHRR